MEEGVGVEVDVPHSGALAVRRGDRGAARAEEARGLPLSPSSAVRSRARWISTAVLSV
jgi:hypothetical protein